MADSLTSADIFTWDTRNWSRVLPLWYHAVGGQDAGLRCLELGAEQGGLSLWLANQGHHVVCSDLQNPESKAKAAHDRFGLAGSIVYQALDATELSFQAEFDVVVFKSILGGIGRDGQYDRMAETVSGIHRALKPGGKLLFVENLEASALHRFARKRFVSWGRAWHYLKLEEIETLMDPFAQFELKTFGFLGAFGRNEGARLLLGGLDKTFDRVIPSGLRYIAGGIAVK